MDGALLAHQQAGAHLSTAGPQRKSCCQLAAIGNAARRDNRDIDGIHYLGHQRHGGHLAHMAAALGAFGDDGIHAQRLQMLCQHGSSHHGDDLDAGFFPHLDILARVARAGGDHLHALFHHDLCKLICKRVHQHDVDAKGLVGQCLAAADVLPQGIRIPHSARADEAQGPRIGAGGRKLAGGDVGHTALNDGVLRPQNLV